MDYYTFLLSFELEKNIDLNSNQSRTFLVIYRGFNGNRGGFFRAGIVLEVSSFFIADLTGTGVPFFGREFTGKYPRSVSRQGHGNAAVREWPRQE